MNEILKLYNITISATDTVLIYIKTKIVLVSGWFNYGSTIIYHSFSLGKTLNQTYKKCIDVNYTTNYSLDKSFD